MKHRMVIMLAFVFLVGGGIFLIQKIKSLASQNKGKEEYIVTVSAMRVKADIWNSTLSAVGSLRALNDIQVTSEVGGIVKRVLFKPGMMIEKETIMVELNADSEKAQLKSLRAAAALAQINYQRDKAQYAFRGVSKAVLDTDLANLKNAQAQVEQQVAVAEKKTIRAPFTGQVGISQVNLGQYLNPGDKIVYLQSLDPIYADFYIPQQDLPRLEKGQPVIINTDAYPRHSFEGKVTSLDSKVNVGTRNVLVEATVPNSEHKLVPGMYAEVHIVVGSPEEFLTIPQTAVSYNSYGDIIYILEHKTKEKERRAEEEVLLTAKQIFVTLGKKRGDQVQVLKGLKKGDLIVTSGQMKLRNGSLVRINNSVKPSDNPHPDFKNKEG